MSETKCKSCKENIRVKKHISQEEINEAIEKLARNKSVQFVSSEVYEFKLLQCKNCEYLEFGTTCRQCGCIVQIRAKLKDARCPMSKQNRWKYNQ